MFHWVLLEIFQCRQAQPQHLEHLDENTMGWCVVFFLSHHRRVPWDHFGLCQIVCITHMHDTSNVLNGLHVKQMARVRKWLQISKVHKSKTLLSVKISEFRMYVLYLHSYYTCFKFNILFIVFLLVGSSSVESVLCFFLWNKKHKSSIWTLLLTWPEHGKRHRCKEPSVNKRLLRVKRRKKNKKHSLFTKTHPSSFLYIHFSSPTLSFGLSL